MTTDREARDPQHAAEAIESPFNLIHSALEGLVAAGSDHGEGGASRSAELLFQNAVAHCDRGELKDALALVESAIHLDKQVAYVERRALILERLGRWEDATMARRQVAALSEQVMLSHLEGVLEFTADGDRVVRSLRENSLFALEASGRDKVTDTAMRTEALDQAMMSAPAPVRFIPANLIKVDQRPPIDRSALLSDVSHDLNLSPGPPRNPRAPSPKTEERGWNLKRAVVALLNRLRSWGA